MCNPNTERRNAMLAIDYELTELFRRAEQTAEGSDERAEYLRQINALSTKRADMIAANECARYAKATGL
jgi:hypothetical protein